MDDTLEERVRAIERTVTDGECELTDLTEEAAARERLAELEAETADLADRVAELEAATQALRGYVGNVRAVNQDVERRADAALKKAESVEERLGTDKRTRASACGSSPEPASADGGRVLDGTAGERCESCGRGGGSTDTQVADSVQSADETDGGSETLVPETSETGALRRIREIL